MSEIKQIGVHIGALCDPIHKQLKAQGIKVSASDVSHFQRAHDGIVQLRVMGCMGDKERDRISQRFVNKVTNWCKQFLNNKNTK